MRTNVDLSERFARYIENLLFGGEGNTYSSGLYNGKINKAYFVI